MVVAPDGQDASLLSQMMAAVEVVLQGIGEDSQREGLLKTPLRVASAFQEALAGYQLSASEIIGPALFTEAGTGGGSGCGGGSGGVVVVSNIDSFALCESCLLPFRLRCHVVYVPCGQRVVGLSKFPRVVEIFAKRLQNPQKFARELVEALNDSFSPLGVGVVVESWHCKWPGVYEGHKVPQGGGDAEERVGFGWVPVAVHAGKGQFENFNSVLWDEFLTILQLDGAEIDRSTLWSTDGQLTKRKCPFLVYDGQRISSLLPEVTCNGSSGRSTSPNPVGLTMCAVSASATAIAIGVEFLLRAMGVVDPSKEELRWTALRFVKWILVATQGSRGSQSYGQDHGAKGCHVVNGMTTVLSNGNGSVSYGNGGSLSNGGPANDYGTENGNVDGFTTIHSKGTSHGNSSMSKGNCNSQVSDGTSANNSLHAYHVASGNGHGLQRTSNREALRYVNGTTLCDIDYLMSNGSSLSRMEVISDEDSFCEGLMCFELDISFSSLCEHHLLPFFGTVHLGYICAKGSWHIDRSLVLRIVAMYSRRLQVQERLTRQIVEAVASFAGLQGAMVVAEASHMCMMSRGVVKLGCNTATVATIGKFSTGGAIRAAFLKRLPRKGTAKKMAH